MDTLPPVAAHETFRLGLNNYIARETSPHSPKPTVSQPTGQLPLIFQLIAVTDTKSTQH